VRSPRSSWSRSRSITSAGPPYSALSAFRSSAAAVVACVNRPHRCAARAYDRAPCCRTREPRPSREQLLLRTGEQQPAPTPGATNVIVTFSFRCISAEPDAGEFRFEKPPHRAVVGIAQIAYGENALRSIRCGPDGDCRSREASGARASAIAGVPGFPEGQERRRGQRTVAQRLAKRPSDRNELARARKRRMRIRNSPSLAWPASSARVPTGQSRTGRPARLLPWPSGRLGGASQLVGCAWSDAVFDVALIRRAHDSAGARSL
jgi:hypothetical protein